MTNKTQTIRIKRIPKVWNPDSELYIPYQGKEITFAYPSFGPDNYQNVGNKILSNNLRLPNGEHTASLVHTAYCNPQVENEPEFKNIREIMKSRYLWVYNQDLWTPKGVYVVQDLKAEGLSRKLEANQLEKMLKNGKDINDIRFSKNGNIRFAPKGTYKLGEQTPEELAKNGFIIASCEKEGAEKLGEVSTKFKYKPYVWGVETEDKSVQSVSVLGGSYDSYRLLFVGDCFDNYNDGHAFGVRK